MAKRKWWDFAPNPNTTSTPKIVDYVVVDEHGVVLNLTPSERAAFHEALCAQRKAT